MSSITSITPCRSLLEAITIRDIAGEMVKYLDYKSILTLINALRTRTFNGQCIDKIKFNLLHKKYFTIYFNRAIRAGKDETLQQMMTNWRSREVSPALVMGMVQYKMVQQLVAAFLQRNKKVFDAIQAHPILNGIPPKDMNGYFLEAVRRGRCDEQLAIASSSQSRKVATKSLELPFKRYLQWPPQSEDSFAFVEKYVEALHKSGRLEDLSETVLEDAHKTASDKGSRSTCKMLLLSGRIRGVFSCCWMSWDYTAKFRYSHVSNSDPERHF